LVSKYISLVDFQRGEKKLQIKGIIFDMDGTLINSLFGLARATNNVLTAIGCPPHDVEAYRYFVGEGIRKMVYRALPEDLRTEETVTRCLPLMQKEYQKHWADNMQLYDGIPELLDELTSLSIKMAILTNKPQEYTGIIMERFLNRWDFDEVIGTREDIPGKPDPTGARLIMDRLGLTAEEMLYLGDTATDMQTAARVGMFAVGALWGFRDAEELKTGASVMIEHPVELLQYL
jgi:phosphoglycolate phosphatase